MTSTAKWSTALLLAVCVSAHAAPDAQVEAMQMPAWVERDGQRSPLEVGAALRNGDRIETGLASRIVLRLADGSTVKLGENARFEIAQMQPAGTAKGIFKATLSVIEGAFRFTTAAIYKFSGQREINVRFHSVTAGIRGTDLWGKSAADRDIVCLIEGHISVSRAGAEAVDMKQPHTVLQAPSSGVLPPVAPVDPAQLAKWAAETEITPGGGAASKGGKWRVYLQRAPTTDEIEGFTAQVAAAGYSARITRLTDEGKPVYWVYVAGLADRREARALADRLQAQFKLSAVSISTR
jgi:hypothetical protein